MPELCIHGRDLFGDPIEKPKAGKLAGDCLVTPFTELNSRDGWWQERKAGWQRLGIESEIGRGDKLLGMSDTIARLKPSAEKEGKGASIFDPVLCEVSYRWYSPIGGTVLDPFAGGSVRGIVAALLGRRYWGCELRPEQVEANRQQAADIAPEDMPEWHCGDARDLLPQAPPADFLFSCPPYFDLERYSDDPRDLSAMDWPAFSAAYREIVAAASERLRPDRFACFVVGDVRCPKGFYRGLPELTVSAFEAAGLRKYNEAVLVTPVGSLPIRVGKQFRSSRKLGKTHQNVLVFVKGDPKRAAAVCGDL